MLYHILYPLRETVFGGFNIISYISFRAMCAAVCALFITFFVGPRIIHWLRKMQFTEEIDKDGPESHKVKAGTVSMGGLIIHCAVILPVLLFCRLDNLLVQLMIISTLWMGVVGFIDDYLKVVKKLPKGLIGRYKLIGQVILGLIVAFSVTYSETYSGFAWSSSVPFLKNWMLNFGIFYIPMVVLIVTGTSNAVNLADGLDGLAIGLIGIAAFAWGAISYVTGHVIYSGYLEILYIPGAGELAIYCSALIGASLGFLWFNGHPATVFMGDTGALALGGAMGTLAVVLKKELLLPIVCGVFIIEMFSVILQVSSYKWRGKRIFKMAPIHHHFELMGWAEEKVVTRFWIIGILLALLTLGTLKIQ
ncbi:phospho-N-acetylmuramoyl-pentapeptide-transferase [bacterium]|nr:phospho-N-acetylmuramoyl-pentapeptide-transferase [bacterium]